MLKMAESDIIALIGHTYSIDHTYTVVLHVLF